MSAQRARSAVPADHRSAHPNVPGVPWWGAVLFAVTMTAVGFAYDAGSGNKELDVVFAALYVLGCVFAVLAVRQSGIFTAVIQPPLLLFVAVPTAYFLFHGAQVGGVKDLAINCGYPLIERFPLMFFTSAAVLLVGLGRWYYAMSSRRGAGQSTANDTKAAKAKSGRVSSVTSKMSSLLTGDADEEDAAEEPRRKHTIDRPSRATKTARSGQGAARTTRTTKRTAPSRSRHTRPPETELIEPVVDRPRRPRPLRQTDQPPPADPPRRRSRSSSTREPRKAMPPERRTSYERPERRRYDDYPPREPHASNGNGSGTHHPVSRVRYRGADESDTRAENRSRPRASRNGWEAESWEYDI